MLVVFHSRNGTVEALAAAAADAARQAGAEVRMRRAREVAGEDAMGQVEGWLDSARRQNALYAAPITSIARPGMRISKRSGIRAAAWSRSPGP